jgi:hypothetical protein
LNLEKIYPQSLIQIHRWNPVLSRIKCQSVVIWPCQSIYVNHDISM